MSPQHRLLFSVNQSSPVSVYAQIENQVILAIAAAQLKPGDNLPSVRELSASIGVNPNTVSKAYRDLELMNLVQTRRGVGATVSKEAPEIACTRVKRMVQAHIEDAVAEALAGGMKPAAVRSAVSGALNAKAIPYDKKRVYS